MTDLELAFQEIQSAQTMKARYVNYYAGNHELAFASAKFYNTFGATLKNLRDNLCPIVVDATVDRMEIINFSSDQDNLETSARAWEIWQHNQMELLAAEVHTDAVKTGAGFLMVWEDDAGAPVFFKQNPLNCRVFYDESSNKPVMAAKLWETTDKLFRLNLYYPDRIEKYITETSSTGISITSKNFIEFNEDGANSFKNANPYGIIPIFEFRTNPVLSDAIPLQDALNKTLADQMVAQEFTSWPQRYATGLELPVNELTGEQFMPFKAAVDRLWVSSDAAVNFGEFSATDLSQFLAVEDALRFEIARVTGTPLHFFSIQIGNNISGEALKTLESRFVKRIIRTSLSFGAVWAEAMRLGLLIDGARLLTSKLTTQWQSPEQSSVSETLANLQLKRDTLEIPVDTLREEFGYTVEDIANFNTANSEFAAAITRQEDVTNYER